MKRIITLLLTLVLACCLFACDSCGDNTSRKNPTLTDTSSVFASIKETVDGLIHTRTYFLVYHKIDYLKVILILTIRVIVVQSLSCVYSVSPWTAACQAPL